MLKELHYNEITSYNAILISYLFYSIINKIVLTDFIFIYIVSLINSIGKDTKKVFYNRSSYYL